MQFSNTVDNTGIVQRARKIARLDATQFPTVNIVNSCNDRLDKIFNYGRGADRKFQLDDSNHTKLPEGTTSLVLNQTDYSFLNDEQGNRITNLTRIALRDIVTEQETDLLVTNIGDQNYNTRSFGIVSGTPHKYDKIADNIIRFDTKPTADDVSRYVIKYYFQRSPSYFTESDTTKEPGVANELHRGFVIQSAYYIAFTLGLQNVVILREELAREDEVMKEYFEGRNTDEIKKVVPVMRSYR